MGLSKHAMPVGMGLMMGPMLLWMLHSQLVGDGTSLLGLAIFVGIHALVLFAALGASIFAARLSPAFRARVGRLHRPSWAHLGKMLASAAVAALTIHLVLHGVA